MEMKRPSIFSMAAGMESKRPSIFSVAADMDNVPENDISDIELMEARKASRVISTAISRIQDQDQKSPNDANVNMTDLLFKLLIKKKHFNIMKNRRRNFYRVGYVAILVGAFLYSATRSLLYVLEEPTTFQETLRPYNATFPSLTCCKKSFHLDFGNRDPFVTFQELNEEINNVFHEKLRAKLEIGGLGVEHQVFDLKNETILSMNFNSSLDQVWQLSSAMYPWKQFHPLNPCITLNVPPLDAPKQGYYEIDFKVTNPPKGQAGLYCIKHEKDQSNHNYEVDSSKGFDKLPRGKGFQIHLVETETTSLKTSRYDCMEDNSITMTNCIDDFIAEQLNCSLPWTKNNNTWRYCQTEEDLALFRKLSFNITSPYLKQKLTMKGCFRPNCKQTSWVSTQETLAWDNNHGESSVKITIPATAKVIQRKEIRLADYGTFIADMGSYLGLYLGASILSLTDMVHVCFKRFLRSEIEDHIV